MDMDRKKSLWILAGAAVLGVILVVVGIMLASADREAPKITMENTSVTYTEGQGYASLLAGVSAYDKRDGDVTEYLIVESVTPLKSGTQAKVWYVAKDKSNNITKQDRIVNYVAAGGNNAAETPTEGEQSGSEGNTGGQESTKNPDSETPAATTGGNQGGEGNRPTAGEQQTPSETAAPLPTEAPGAVPVLTLKSGEGTIHVGERFNVNVYVDNIVDDVDDRDVLFRRIIADGSYDIHTAGDYTLTIYCSDTDRNLSEKQTFILHVVE